MWFCLGFLTISLRFQYFRLKCFFFLFVVSWPKQKNNDNNIFIIPFKGRAWLRSSLNEHSLEKYFHHMLGNRTVIRYVRQHAILLTNVMCSEIIMALTFMNAMCSCNLIMQGCYLWVWYWLPDFILFYLQPVLWKGSFPYERWTCQYATYDCSRLLCVFYGYGFFFQEETTLS